MLSFTWYISFLIAANVSSSNFKPCWHCLFLKSFAVISAWFCVSSLLLHDRSSSFCIAWTFCTRSQCFFQLLSPSPIIVYNFILSLLAVNKFISCFSNPQFIKIFLRMFWNILCKNFQLMYSDVKYVNKAFKKLTFV